MDNEITINIDYVKNCLDNSITDSEIIRQIALYGIKTGDNSLNCKIRKDFEFLGLYPSVMKVFDIKPDKIKNMDGNI